MKVPASLARSETIVTKMADDQANTGGSVAGEPVNEQSGTTPTPSEVPENVQASQPDRISGSIFTQEQKSV
ncbi:hypothetical protein KUTeg_013267 [Tegillarca granosa]|uniref:Uncharacterized protein n=1 Tax=Tegillarca granosa TaxID=220873 RepID=A0ABQ9ET73_TEGGR|nr:hypothetical protein KUTeg_013267 [Tegillarca granosa]